MAKPSPASNNKKSAAHNAAASAAVGTTAATDDSEKKSIVPPKYAGKYKNGGEGPLADFIRAQCEKDGNFDWSRFFAIARLNGIDEAKVANYEQSVNSNENGGKGRARMTIGNMLRAIARKNGELKGVNKQMVPVKEAPVAVSGAAAAKKAA